MEPNPWMLHVALESCLRRDHCDHDTDLVCSVLTGRSSLASHVWGSILAWVVIAKKIKLTGMDTRHHGCIHPSRRTNRHAVCSVCNTDLCGHSVVICLGRRHDQARTVSYSTEVKWRRTGAQGSKNIASLFAGARKARRDSE